MTGSVLTVGPKWNRGRKKEAAPTGQPTPHGSTQQAEFIHGIDEPLNKRTTLFTLSHWSLPPCQSR